MNAVVASRPETDAFKRMFELAFAFSLKSMDVIFQAGLVEKRETIDCPRAPDPP
jgi:hypothetical protein